jgi:hypothetical protein
MANTRVILLPFAAEFPAANFPQLDVVNRRPILGFDTTTDETCYWTFKVPQGLTGTINLIIDYITTVTSGTALFGAQIEAVTDGDATDLDAGTSFDTVNLHSAVTVPGTAGYIDQITIALSNVDSWAAGDYVRLALYRDVSGDTAAADIQVLAVELRDAA